jgi:hypothetical protein
MITAFPEKSEIFAFHFITARAGALIHFGAPHLNWNFCINLGFSEFPARSAEK